MKLRNKLGQFVKGSQWSKGNKPNQTSFQKGHIPITKGRDNRIMLNCKNCGNPFLVKKSSINRRSNCSKVCYFKSKIGIPSWNKNIPMRSEVRLKLGQILMGRTPWNKGLFGEKSTNWIKDRTKLKRNSTNRSNDYACRDWAKQVKKRDKQCQLKDENCDGYLVAHHIKPWRDYPELRYEINNGITLCQAHHPCKRIDEKQLMPRFMALVGISV